MENIFWNNKNIHWFIFIIAFAFLIIGQILIMEYPDVLWWVLLSKTGEVFVIGGIIGFFSSYGVILSGYRRELIGIIYESKFLKNRRDIVDIWITVSKVMFKEKFYKINSELLSLVKDTYLSVDFITYYNDYETVIKIECDEVDGYIKVCDDSKYELITDSTEEFTFYQDNWIQLSDGDVGVYSNMEVKVLNNNMLITNKESEGIVEEDGNLRQMHSHCELKIKGSEKYSIIKKTQKRYNIENDNFICFRTKYITNNLDVKIVHPSNLELVFERCGTKKIFTKTKLSETVSEFKYKGLILPQQGYVIFLKHKNIN